MAASVAYPEWLPMPLQDGYGFKPISPLVVDQFTSGSTMNRRGYLSTPTRAPFSWLLTAPVAALFEKWFQEDLYDGSAWFLCKLRTPLGIDYYRSKFTDIYEGPTLVGGNYWQYDVTLELFRRPLLADGSTKEPDVSFILGSELVDLAANREWPGAEG